jgi:hypothetical protein
MNDCSHDFWGKLLRSTWPDLLKLGRQRCADTHAHWERAGAVLLALEHSLDVPCLTVKAAVADIDVCLADEPWCEAWKSSKTMRQTAVRAKAMLLDVLGQVARPRSVRGSKGLFRLKHGPCPKNCDGTCRVMASMAWMHKVDEQKRSMLRRSRRRWLCARASTRA